MIRITHDNLLYTPVAVAKKKNLTNKTVRNAISTL